jgi:hypothetical protein
MVSIPPQASVTASVTSPNDSMLMIVLVCLGFYMLSATISAAIGAIMHLSGGPALGRPWYGYACLHSSLRLLDVACVAFIK